MRVDDEIWLRCGRIPAVQLQVETHIYCVPTRSVDRELAGDNGGNILWPIWECSRD
jgi:hypothetical protein